MRISKRFVIGAPIVILSILGCLVIWLGRGPSGINSRQIASALLELHHQESSNGYRFRSYVDAWPENIEALHPMPRSHDKYMSVSTNAAYVWWKDWKWKVEWCRGYEIRRSNTKEVTWTLRQFQYVTSPAIPAAGWEKTLITVTNTYDQNVPLSLE